MATIKCEFDSHLFDGFQTDVDIKNVETLDEIIVTAVSILYSTLKMYNLKGLIQHLDPLTFKIENVTMDDIKKNLDKVIIIKEDEDNISSSSD